MNTPIFVTIILAVLVIVFYISNKRGISNNSKRIKSTESTAAELKNKHNELSAKSELTEKSLAETNEKLVNEAERVNCVSDDICRVSDDIVTLKAVQRSTSESLKRTNEKLKSEIARTTREFSEQLEITDRKAREYTDTKNAFFVRAFQEQITELTKAVDALIEENKVMKADIERLTFTSSTEIEKASKSLNDENQLPPTEDRLRSLDDEQEYFCRQMNETTANFFITGKAGTGKSYLLEAFKKATNRSYVVLAPTGIAALNVGGSTLHSAFGYDNLEKLGVDEITEESIHLNSNKRILLRQVKMIIIDEISMVRADTFDKIDRILKVLNDTDKPFGGKQMLVFGDLFQLPPVVNTAEKKFLTDTYGGIYFFHSSAFKAGRFGYFELHKNHRQESDTEFFDILNAIREGNRTQENLDVLNTRISSESKYDRFTTLVPKRADADAINNQHLDDLELEVYTYEAKVLLDKLHLGKGDILKNFPISQTLRLCKGALIMMVANDPEHRWVNGTMGIVNGFAADSIFVSIEGKTYEVLPTEFTQQEVTVENGKMVYTDVLTVLQYPIVLAYAITIHKSQGQTFKNVVCDVKRCFADGQAYVALSRCTSLEGLHLKSEVTAGSIKVAHDVVEFSKNQAANAVM